MMDEIYPNNQFLRVATNGCGDDFGYRLEDNKTLSRDIYMWDHEVDELTLVALNLKEVITKYYNDEI